MTLELGQLVHASLLLESLRAPSVPAGPQWLACIVACLLCICISDSLWRRVANAGVLVALALAAWTWAVALGRAGLAECGCGFLSAFCALLVPYAMGKVGGADVKVLGAFGALVGLHALPLLLLSSAFFAGAIGLVTLWSHGAGLRQIFWACIAPGQALELARSRRTTMPLTVALSGGVVVALFGGSA